MAVLFMLGSADVYSAQRILTLAAASHNDTTLSPDAFVDEIVRSVKYKRIAFVARQVDRPRSGHFENGYASASSDASALNANAARACPLNVTRPANSFSNSPLTHGRRSSHPISSKEVLQAKRNSICSTSESLVTAKLIIIAAGP